jgi:hypothetical protein
MRAGEVGDGSGSTHQHFRASISFPGVSRHLRIKAVCWRTAMRASSRRRAWSSGGAGVDMVLSAAALEVSRVVWAMRMSGGSRIGDHAQRAVGGASIKVLLSS